MKFLPALRLCALGIVALAFSSCTTATSSREGSTTSASPAATATTPSAAPATATKLTAPAPVASVAAAVVTPAALKPIRLVIVGDSTVCNWPLNDNLHRQGWGMQMQPYFVPALTVSNLALSGRSTKTFINEGHWARALAEKPAVILIQFGHNDSHASTNPESTDAATAFRDYLRKYIDDSRAIGAIPVLITPMCRRTPTDNLGPYADAMKAVGAEKNVAVIDLHASSAKLYAELGPDGVNTLAANLANGTYDQTHFNEAGAKAMAKLVMAELPADVPELKPYVK